MKDKRGRFGLHRTLAMTLLVSGVILLIGCPGEPDPDPTFAKELTIYWAGTEMIRKGDLGTWSYGVTTIENATTLLTDASMRCIDIEVDTVNGKLYWTEEYPDGGGTYRIRRANTDGSSVEILVPGLDIIEHLALDVTGGKMYWCTEIAGVGSIWHANLDGSGAVELVSTTTFPQSIGLRLDAPKTLYWCRYDGGDARNEIRTATVADPVTQSDVVTSNISAVGAMAYADGYLYWADPSLNRIYRIIYGGTDGDEVLLDALSESPSDLEVDVAGGKFYWIDTATDSVYRANPDGSNQQNCNFSGTASGIALAP